MSAHPWARSLLPVDTRSGGMGIVRRILRLRIVRPVGFAIPGLTVPGVGMVTTQLTIGAGA